MSQPGYRKSSNIILDFYKRNESLILKGTPLLMGFFIFFAYFIQHAFFPTVDLFSLASLLTAAFFIGAFFLISVFLVLVYPAWSWSRFFLLDQELWQNKKETTANKDKDKDKDKDSIIIVTEFFVLPILLSCVLNSWGGSIFPSVEYKISIFFLSAALVSLLFGLLVCWHHKLSKLTIVKYIATTFPPLIFSNLICLSLEVAFLYSDKDQNPILKSIPPVLFGTMAGIFLVSIIAYTTHKHSLEYAFMSATMALLCIGLTDIQSTAPPQIVKMLGVGNYTASAIILKGETCQSSRDTGYILRDCTLEDPFIIWGLGDSYKLVHTGYFRSKGRNSSCSDEKLCKAEITIPKESVLAIVNKQN